MKPEKDRNVVENEGVLSLDETETRSSEAYEMIAHMLLNRYIKQRDADRVVEE